MTVKGAIIMIALSVLIGYFIPPIVGGVMILIAKMRDKHIAESEDKE